MFLVAGVSGNTGSKVANLLLEKGEQVRVLVRDEAKGAPWKAKGCEVIAGSLRDPEFVSRAFEGIASAYLLNPPAMGSDDPVAHHGPLGLVAHEHVHGGAEVGEALDRRHPEPGARARHEHVHRHAELVTLR